MTTFTPKLIGGLWQVIRERNGVKLVCAGIWDSEESAQQDCDRWNGRNAPR